MVTVNAITIREIARGALNPNAFVPKIILSSPPLHCTGRIIKTISIFSAN